MFLHLYHIPRDMHILLPTNHYVFLLKSLLLLQVLPVIYMPNKQFDTCSSAGRCCNDWDIQDEEKKSNIIRSSKGLKGNLFPGMQKHGIGSGNREKRNIIPIMRSPKGLKRNGVFSRLQKHGSVSGNVSSFGGEMIDALEGGHK
jgi:hypothetical protein